MTVIMNVSPERLEELKAGKNDKSEEVISYFLEDKCCSSGMKDKDYQELVSEFANSVTPQTAANKLGIDLEDAQELEPVRLAGYKFFWGDGTTSDCLFARTDSGELISSVYEVSYLLFSDDQLYLYSRRCSFHNDQKKPELTNEFFFKDVVSLSIRDVESESKWSEGEFDSQVFTLTVPGDKISIAVSVDDETEASIQGMKQKLREKKQQK